MVAWKRGVKRILGKVPLTAELEWWLFRRGKSVTGFNIDFIENNIEIWKQEVMDSKHTQKSGKKIFIFCMLNYWINHGMLLGLALAGLGHEVTFSFLPSNQWKKNVLTFTERQDNLYAKYVLKKAAPLMNVISLLDLKTKGKLPKELQSTVELISERDVQYTNQVEDVDKNGEFFLLRLQRNKFAAQVALNWMEENKPDVVLVPNGMILEFGAIFQAAKHSEIPVTSYEFGEQKEQIWFSQNQEVMLQDTKEMWANCKDWEFTEEEQHKIKELFASRQQADLFQNFSRQWQSLPSEGGEKAREKLDLDDRPIVLLAANVIGDSLTLGRQVFSETMTEWLERTIGFFAGRDEVQFILRVHPGERYLEGGPSVEDIVNRLFPNPPENFHIVSWDAPINTYDLASIADVGLVYTTTTGMEMVMGGVPVIVAGWTHYRGKGFTLDPDSWREYYEMLERIISYPKDNQLTEEQVKTAWHYAYRFFFDYPEPFPWHLVGTPDDIKKWPLNKVLSDDGNAIFGETFEYLLGKPAHWKNGIYKIEDNNKNN